MTEEKIHELVRQLEPLFIGYKADGDRLKNENGMELRFYSDFGFKDWNTASAMTEQSATVELPIATKFQTTGELMDFLANFDRSQKLVVNEYAWRGLEGGEPFVTSACTLTYDKEIQTEGELRLELNTEVEHKGVSLGQSASQKFDTTPAGRSQRRIKAASLFNLELWGNFIKPNRMR